jgi:phosphoribosylformimino-5-aminoimidazole carboxamide ribotide isomerase
MLLIIPSITIKDGHCIGKISYPGASLNAPEYDRPEDRARLLRKENAKALHLIFKDEWDSETTDLVERISRAVDIPILISLPSLPEDILIVKQIIESGIYRLLLPSDASDTFLNLCIHDFSRQKIVVSIQLELASRALLERLRQDGLIRICITMPENEQRLPLVKLQEIANLAREKEMRLSLLFGVYSYKALIELANLRPGFDSVILGKALDENSFPCQDIWREIEQKDFSARGTEANLWKNPLELVPHI